VPRLRKLPLETAIIERYKRRESSVEEALIEMYLAGVSMRRVEDITGGAVGRAHQRQHGQLDGPEGVCPDRGVATAGSMASMRTATSTASAPPRSSLRRSTSAFSQDHRIIKVAATVVQTTRRVVVELSASWPFWKVLAPALRSGGRRNVATCASRVWQATRRVRTWSVELGAAENRSGTFTKIR
jgi:hypothetical protein